MKKVTSLMLVIALIITCSLGVVLVGVHLSNGNGDVEELPPPNFDLDYAEDAVRTTTDEGISLKFSSTVTFNTVALVENGDVIREFSFYYVEDGQEKFFYKQDLVQNYRYCSFNDVTTDELIIKINEVEGQAWQIDEINVYNIKKTHAYGFRVTAYAVSQYTYKAESLDKEHFKAINHVNLISTVYIAADGELYFRDNYIDGVLVDGKTIFETSLQNVKAVVEEGTTIVATLLGQDFNGSGMSVIEIHEAAFKENKENFIKNAVAFQEKYGLDGLSFDYEYPETVAQYATMFETCRSLKEAMKPGSIMTVALGTWAIYKPLIFDKALMGCVDWVESMNYDEMRDDPHSYHSSFSTSCYNFFDGIENFNRQFADANGVTPPSVYVDKAHLNLGIPFYSRPLDGRGYWGEYKAVAEELGRYENVYYGEYYDGELLPPTYYNSYQMVYDKVCYCIDHGIGGVMVWHYSCDVSWDSGLSLWNAIYEAVQSRS